MQNIFLFVVCLIKATVTLTKFHGVSSLWSYESNLRTVSIPWMDEGYNLRCTPWSPEYLLLFQTHLERCGIHLSCKNGEHLVDQNTESVIVSKLITNNFPVLHNIGNILNSLLMLQFPTFGVKVVQAAKLPACFGELTNIIGTIPSFFSHVFNFTNPFRARREVNNLSGDWHSEQGAPPGSNILIPEHKKEKNVARPPTIYEDVPTLMISSTKSSVSSGSLKSPFGSTTSPFRSTKKPNLIKLKKIPHRNQLQSNAKVAPRIGIFDDVSYDEIQPKRKSSKSSRRKQSDSPLMTRKSNSNQSNKEDNQKLELKMLGLSIPRPVDQSRKFSKPKIKPQPNIASRKPKTKEKIKLKQKDEMGGRRVSGPTKIPNDYDFTEHHKTPLKPYYAFEGPMFVNLNNPEETKMLSNVEEREVFNETNANKFDSIDIAEDVLHVNPRDAEAILKLAFYLKNKFLDNPDFLRNAQQMQIDNNYLSKSRRSNNAQPFYPYMRIILKHYGYDMLPLNNGGIFYERQSPNLEKRFSNTQDPETEELIDDIEDKKKSEKDIRLTDFVQGIRLELNENKLSNCLRNIAREKFNLENVIHDRDIELVWEYFFDEVLESLDGMQITFDGEIIDVRVKENETAESPKRTRTAENMQTKDESENLTNKNSDKDKMIFSQILKMVSKRSMQRTFLLNKPEFRFVRKVSDGGVHEETRRKPEFMSKQKGTSSKEYVKWVDKLMLHKNKITFSEDPTDGILSKGRKHSDVLTPRFLRGTADDPADDDSSPISLHFLFTPAKSTENGKSRIQDLDLHVHVPDDFAPFSVTKTSFPEDDVESAESSVIDNGTNDVDATNESKSTVLLPGKIENDVLDDFNKKLPLNNTNTTAVGDFERKIIEYIDYTINRLTQTRLSADVNHKRLMLLTSLMYLFNITEEKLAQDSKKNAELKDSSNDVELNRVDRKAEYPYEFVRRLTNLCNILSERKKKIAVRRQIKNTESFDNSTSESRSSLEGRRQVLSTYDYSGVGPQTMGMIEGASEDEEFVPDIDNRDNKNYDTVDISMNSDIQDGALNRTKHLIDYSDEPISNKSLALFSAVRLENANHT